MRKKYSNKAKTVNKTEIQLLYDSHFTLLKEFLYIVLRNKPAKRETLNMLIFLSVASHYSVLSYIHSDKIDIIHYDKIEEYIGTKRLQFDYLYHPLILLRMQKEPEQRIIDFVSFELIFYPIIERSIPAITTPSKFSTQLYSFIIRLVDMYISLKLSVLDNPDIIQEEFQQFLYSYVDHYKQNDPQGFQSFVSKWSEIYHKKISYSINDEKFTDDSVEVLLLRMIDDNFKNKINTKEEQT